jgi:hypothetical protein
METGNGCESEDDDLPLVRGRRRGGGEMQITPVALTWEVTDLDPAVAKRAFDAMMEMKKIDITAIEAALRG